MATTATPTILNNGQGKKVEWTLANTEDGDAIEFGDFPDRSVQVTGTFGSGGTIVWEGSNDGTNYATLTDPIGEDVSFTSAGLIGISEITRYARPSVTAGDGATDLDITVYMRGDFL